MLPKGYELNCNFEDRVIFATYIGYHPDPYAVWKMEDDILFNGRYFCNPKEAMLYFSEVCMCCKENSSDANKNDNYEEYKIQGNTIGERLRFLRIKEGITQAELAKHLGLAPDTIRSYEKDRRKPKLEVINLLEKYFEIKKYDLLPPKEEVNNQNTNRFMTTNRKINDAELRNLPFNHKLKYLRVLNGYTQRDLSNVTGIALNTIVNYEINRRKPTGENLIKLSKALDYPADLLIAEPDNNKGACHEKNRTTKKTK